MEVFEYILTDPFGGGDKKLVTSVSTTIGWKIIIFSFFLN